ncbi:N-formylglutamate deformylase [Pseudodonghicola flavimaris]|uniref:N-formylglutamate deformylase n=1 Tax=Pseudodonghicola flavimaris TaxID=3050036 RepID=A0ABT7EWC0_9RHOB|nr:N-formylglutamate deformylase [Pseudodonghicola flavimaris]MDK3016580.1 N-formylglutamate deformylase [Pseudodonghicola flavimaris]
MAQNSGQSFENTVFNRLSGEGPVLLSVPHAGEILPDSLRAALTPEAAGLRDTDWHMDRIARDVLPEGGSLLAARVTRYAVDLNRSKDDTPLYTGATTGLISTIDFDGTPLYRPGAEPTATERAARIATYWEPYHAALAAEIDRIRAAHGYCLLLDVHSIRSRVPRLFEGRLPDLNLGTNSGASCAPALGEAAFAALQDSGFSAVRDARFKGGFITRHYGNPAQNVHALQIEIAQDCYMIEEHPWTYLPERADRLKDALSALIAVMTAFKPELEPRQ